MLGCRMKTEQAIVLGVVLVAVGFAAYWEALYGVREQIEITPELLSVGKERPPLWIFYDNSQVNSRFWSDFGARSSRVINIPILNLFYQTIVKANGDYRVEVIGGLQGVAELLGMDAMPRTMRNLRGSVGVAQEDWIRTAILAKFGGLWVSPSVICVKGFGKLPEKLIAFGQDDTPMYSTSVPGFRAMWSPAPQHPALVEWEARSRERLDSKLGGHQIRGDAKSDWFDLCHGRADVEIRAYDELSRHPLTQKKLQLEDIFATRIQGGDLPFEIPETTKYMVIPYHDMVNRTMFSWVLKNSEEQILESDMAISAILRNLLKLN